MLLARLVVVKGPDLSGGAVTGGDRDLLARLALAHVQTQPGVVVLELTPGAEAPPLVHVLVVARRHLHLDGVRLVLTAAGVDLMVGLMISNLSL